MNSPRVGMAFGKWYLDRLCNWNNEFVAAGKREYRPYINRHALLIAANTRSGD